MKILLSNSQAMYIIKVGDAVCQYGIIPHKKGA